LELLRDGVLTVVDITGDNQERSLIGTTRPGMPDQTPEVGTSWRGLQIDVGELPGDPSRSLLARAAPALPRPRAAHVRRDLDVEQPLTERSRVPRRVASAVADERVVFERGRDTGGVSCVRRHARRRMVAHVEDSRDDTHATPFFAL
jgi:hypothetical protein